MRKPPLYAVYYTGDGPSVLTQSTAKFAAPGGPPRWPGWAGHGESDGFAIDAAVGQV
jgi:hypothetical protein